MSVVNVTLGDGKKLNLPLGRQGENEVTAVVFDFSAWSTEFGSGTLSLSVQRHGDELPYAVTMTTSGTNATWTISDLDTAYKGTGEAQVKYTVGTKVKKSAVYKFTVNKSLGQNGEYPSPGQTWQEEIEDELADVKQDLADLQEEIEGGGQGLTAEFKQALHNIFEKVAFIDGNGQDYLDALDDAMSSVTAISLNTNTLSFSALNTTQQLTATTTPSGGAVSWSSSNTSVATVSSSGVVTSVGYGTATITASSGSVSASCSVVVAQATLVSIACVYTQSGTVYESTSLDSLKNDLVVTATWDNSTTSTVASTDYELSGTLTEGTSTITVTYGGKTTTFNVTVSSTVQYVKVGNPTITDNILTPSYGNFIRTNIPFSPNGQPWEIRTKLRVLTLPTNWRSVIGSVDSDGVYAKICQIQINSNKQLTMYGSSDGVNWDALSNFYTDNNALNETGIWYYIKFEFTGTAYKITLYKDGWDGTVYKTKSTNSSTSIMDGQYYGFGLSRDSSIVYMDAEYDLSETKIYINGNLAWSAIAE